MMKGKEKTKRLSKFFVGFWWSKLLCVSMSERCRDLKAHPKASHISQATKKIGLWSEECRCVASVLFNQCLIWCLCQLEDHVKEAKSKADKGLEVAVLKAAEGFRSGPREVFEERPIAGERKP